MKSIYLKSHDRISPLTRAGAPDLSISLLRYGRRHCVGANSADSGNGTNSMSIAAFIRRKPALLFMLVISLLMLPASAGAQAWSGILSAGRAIDWSTAGIPGGIPNRTTNCATLNASTFGSGSSDATSGIQAALNSCASGQVVSLSAGTFRLNGVLSIPSNVTLRGQGANQTILDIHSTSGRAAITLGSGSPNISQDVSITGGATAGSTSIVVSSAANISVGKYLQITELNDPSFVSINGSEGACTWCDGGIGYNGTRVAGQIVEVQSVSGTTIGISPGLFINYLLTPKATPFAASVKNAGVEDLQVYANNTGAGSSFIMSTCAYCWIRGVENNYADGDHVDVDYSYHGEIVNSYFSNAYLHAPGSFDSDVVLRNKTTGFLVQNNILERLHVSIMLEWGPAGNVIAYNYMFGNFDSGGAGLLFPGINTHGAHPMFNLFEGNIDPHFHVDSIWGSHSHNTTFRNWDKGTTKIGCTPSTGRGTVSCASGFYTVQGDRAIDIDFLGSNYNLVGDVVGSAQMQGLGKTSVQQVVAVCGVAPCGPGSRVYDTSVYLYSLGYGESSDDGSSGFDRITPYATMLLHGEYSNVTGSTTWASGVTQSLPASFYLSSKPAWFGSTHWPAIGPDVTGGIGPGGHAYAIPAQVCYENIMGGTDGTGSPRTFNASACYAASSSSSAGPNPPTGLKAVAQ
jgi:hypothetical protein